MDRDEPHPLLRFFGQELRRLRESRGLTQEALGRILSYSDDTISKIELAARTPKPRFASKCDTFFKTDGVLSRLVREAGVTGDDESSDHATWFQTWVDAEPHAAMIRWWHPLLCPGLVQTAGYAHALSLPWHPVDGPEQAKRDVDNRLARQAAVFDHPHSPALGIIIDEWVLHRPIGSLEIMRTQLMHLVEMSERTRVTIQVLPSDVGAHAGLLGGFAVAEFHDQPGMVYLDSPDTGETSRDPERLSRLRATYEALRDDALNVRMSRDLIMEVAESKWTT